MVSSPSLPSCPSSPAPLPLSSPIAWNRIYEILATGGQKEEREREEHGESTTQIAHGYLVVSNGPSPLFWVSSEGSPWTSSISEPCRTSNHRSHPSPTGISVFTSPPSDLGACLCLRNTVKPVSSQPHFGASISRVGNWCSFREFREKLNRLPSPMPSVQKSSTSCF